MVLAALSDGSKAVVSVTSGYRESTQSWSEVLRDLKGRGMGCPRLVIVDGHLGIWGALRSIPRPRSSAAGIIESTCWPSSLSGDKPALLILSLTPRLEKKHNDSSRFFSTGAGSD